MSYEETIKNEYKEPVIKD